MRVVFMGTPAFATILDDLAEQHDVAAVYASRRGARARQALRALPVKAAAERRGLRVLTGTLRDEAAARAGLVRPDVICVAAYSAILPKEVLDIPRFGCLSVHASLLPRWRGAAPIERAILAGDEEAGVCIMRMEEGLDTGAYCVCRTAIVDGKSASSLPMAGRPGLARCSPPSCMSSATLPSGRQDEQVTYASKIEKRELDLSPNDDVALAARKVQASSAHPSRAVVAGRASPCSKRTRPRTRRVASWRRIRPGSALRGQAPVLGMDALEVGAQARRQADHGRVRSPRRPGIRTAA
ncbi:MAG: methionyl-tRNA formyltransferase [Eggerthellaceae bacterium]